MGTEAQLLDWEPIDTDDIEESWVVIRDYLLQLFQQFAPIRRSRPHAKRPTWFDHELGSLFRMRNRAWKHYRTSNSGYDEYRVIRNQCSAARVAKRHAFQESLAAKSATALKGLFAYLKRRTRTVPGLPSLVDNGITADTGVDRSGVLARHYASMYAGAEISVSSPSSTRRVLYSHPPDVISISAPYLGAHNVAKVLRGLRQYQSPGPYGVHPLVLKELADVVSTPLAQMFNLSLRTSRLPSDRKKALVVPLFKGGDKHAPVNYRPGLSCLSNFLLARNYWVESRADGCSTGVVFVDFSKAFDNVSHAKLLVKLRSTSI
ncbi:unnamed protein product [Echinostoma caproni]|uniref:Reverse transcriptase domain-containing protein n=1 Tax=Echinostoma caproni TaxID=27848 RepID=A0A183BEL9_9TREM|nr:unnamed protein product [Echinostoma caproni]